MLTPQEVSMHSFQKARFGGYNMAAVDEFLDTLTEDFTTLYKENTALKAKMKVLVDKVEEYRATEESMRATLLSAKKMADQIVTEANEESAELLKKAREELQAVKSEMQMEVRREEERLRIAKEEGATFLSNLRRLCNSELEFLDGVPEMKIIVEQADAAAHQAPAAEEPAPAVEHTETVPEPVPVGAAQDSAVQESVPQDSAAQEESPVPPETPRQETEDLSATRRIAAEDLSATRRIDFGDLKFGRNYRQQKQ